MSQRYGGGLSWGDENGGPEMMKEGPADLLELVRLLDVLVVCSSTGWTDEKHLLYLRLLEESFIRKLHAGDCQYKGLFNCSSRSGMHVESSKQIVKYEYADQGGLEITEGEQAKASMKAEHVESASCSGSQKDEQVCPMNDNASTSEPVEEARLQIRQTNLGHSSKCYSGKHRHSPSRSAEGSDQNFAEEAKGIGESGGFNEKRLKPADAKKNNQVKEPVCTVVPCMKEQAACPNGDKDEDKCNGSSMLHAGLLDSEAGSPPCKHHGPTG